MSQPKRRILLVGAGNRARSTVLPAIHCLADELELVGVLTRSERAFSLGSKTATTITNIDSIDFSSLDILYISVSVKEVASVLKRFGTHDLRHVTLILDTPGIYFMHLLSLKFMKSYRKVLVAEDFPGMRIYEEAKKIIESGAIGSLKSLTFTHSGVFHHTAALIRSLTKTHYFPSIRKIQHSKDSSTLAFTCANGATADIILPRDYARGSFRFEGSTGVISDRPLEESATNFVLAVEKTATGGYGGIRINGALQDETEIEHLFRERLPSHTLASVSINEPLWMNEMKIHSLMRLLRSPENSSYGPIDALYDWLPYLFLEKLGRFYDSQLGKQSSLFRSVIKALSGV